MPTETRLPTTVRPRNYAVTLTPNLSDFTFQGEETIAIELREPTTHVTLHSLELEIAHCAAVLADGRRLEASAINLDNEEETASIVFHEPLPTGSATLELRFSGTLNDQLRGFYRSQYTGIDGQMHYLATTQFEATDARRAFPCWDEPAIKATFRVTLVIPDHLVAISNLPVEAEEQAVPGLKAVRFAESPLMSTYLLAFLVGDFESLEKTGSGGTLVRVWTTKGKVEQGRVALESAVRLLDYYNNYFGIPYPLKKLDHIAIPDFAAGAMENWGAVTYRETALLYDPGNSAASTRQRILEVVAHEMAHMWFGDLVTMEWWDDLWLNESFATWMATKAVDQLYPEWHMWTQFVSHDTNAGLSLDGLRNSHPIEVAVSNPAQIRELFDAISYSKGAAVLRMLEQFLGEETFRKGIQAYLFAHQHGNARTEDLWAALGAASAKPVAEVMHSWIRQTGYPVVDVRPDGQSLHLEQRRFLYDHLFGAQQEDATLWQVPVGIRHATGGDTVALLLKEREQTIPLPPDSPSPGNWTKANTGQTGFYRANYSTPGWAALRDAVARKELPPVDRLGLQNDAYALVRAGVVPATLFLSLINAYRAETDAVVWEDLSANLGSIHALLADEAFLPAYEKAARGLFTAIVEQVGWEARPEEGHLDVLLRNIVLGNAGVYGEQRVLDEARRRFERYLPNPSTLRPDLRGTVVALAAHQGDRATYDTLWEMAKLAQLQEEKLRFLRALGRFQQPELLQLTLERSLSQDVRIQDTVTVIGSVASNRRGRAPAWEFIKTNWDEFDRRYGKGGFAIATLVGMTGNFTTLELAAEVEAFFATHPVPSAQMALQRALERIRLNAKWLESNRPTLAEWLSQNA